MNWPSLTSVEEIQSGKHIKMAAMGESAMIVSPNRGWNGSHLSVFASIHGWTLAVLHDYSSNNWTTSAVIYIAMLHENSIWFWQLLLRLKSLGLTIVHIVMYPLYFCFVRKHMNFIFRNVFLVDIYCCKYMYKMSSLGAILSYQ